MQRIRNPQYRVYRIVKDDRNIGYLSTRKTDEVILQSLYVLEEYQHQGIGRTAFEFVRQYCRENSTDAFVCHCLPENWNARKFYEKNGRQSHWRGYGQRRKLDEFGNLSVHCMRKGDTMKL